MEAGNMDTKNWKYYSIFDARIKELLETGRNSTSIEEAVNNGIDFVVEQMENEDCEMAKKLSLKEKIELLGTDEYVIVGHDEKAYYAVDGVDYEHIGIEYQTGNEIKTQEID